MTRQEAFNISCNHLLTTRVPSLGEDGVCIYGGTGCALAPFAESEEQKERWEGKNVRRINPHYLPEYINRDTFFYNSLQVAHDAPHHTSAVDLGDRWFPEWVKAARKVAKEYDLDDSILDGV